MAELQVPPPPLTWKTLRSRLPKSNREPLKNPTRRSNLDFNQTGSQPNFSPLRGKYQQS